MNDYPINFHGDATDLQRAAAQAARALDAVARGYDETSRGAERAERAAESQRRGLGGLLQPLRDLRAGYLAAAAGFAVVARGAAQAGAAAVEMAADLAETESRFITVLGPSRQLVQTWIDAEAAAAGLTRRAGQDLLATSAQIAQGFGASQAASASLAIAVAELGGDLASFHNLQGGAAEAVEIVNAALTGERERLKQLGIVLQQAGVDHRALADSGKRAASELTALDRATASLQLIIERAGVAVGDLDRTADSAANRLRRFEARMHDVREAALGAAGEGIIEGLLPALDGLAAWVDENEGDITDAFRTIGESIGAAIDRFRELQESGALGFAIDVTAFLQTGGRVRPDFLSFAAGPERDAATLEEARRLAALGGNENYRAALLLLDEIETRAIVRESESLRQFIDRFITPGRLPEITVTVEGGPSLQDIIGEAPGIVGARRPTSIVRAELEAIRAGINRDLRRADALRRSEDVDPRQSIAERLGLPALNLTDSDLFGLRLPPIDLTALDDMAETAEATAAAMERAFRQAGDAIVDALLGVEVEWSQVLRSILSGVAQIAFIDPLAESIGTGVRRLFGAGASGAAAGSAAPLIGSLTIQSGVTEEGARGAVAEVAPAIAEASAGLVAQGARSRRGRHLLGGR